jgi:hypothetical protein
LLIGFLVAANLAPYVAAGSALLLRRLGYVHGRLRTGLWAIVAYLVIIPLAPTGSDGPAIQRLYGWVAYVLAFMFVGSLTWLTFAFYVYAWAVWVGRLRTNDLMPRAGVPVFAAASGFAGALIPWVPVVTQLPYNLGDLVMVILVAGVVALVLLSQALGMAQNPPRFLIPPDMRSPGGVATPQRPTRAFWIDLLLAFLWAAVCSALLLPLALSGGAGGAIARLLSIPLVIGVGAVIHLVARALTPR